MAAALLALMLTACSDDGGTAGEDRDDTSSPDPSAATTVPELTSEADLVDCIALMDRPEVRRLAGGPMSAYDSDYIVREDGSPRGCSAHIDGGRAHGAKVYLAVVPAHQGVALFTSGLEELDGSPLLEPEVQAVVTDALRAARTGEEDDELGCDIFSAFAVAATKQERGANYIVTLPPEDGRLPRLVAQACTGGLYVTVGLSGPPDIKVTPALLRHVQAAAATYSRSELTAFREPPVDDSACQLLPAAFVTSVAGPDAEPEPGSLPASRIPGCAYGDSLFVAQGSADDWLRTAPAFLELLVQEGVFDGRPAVLRRIELALDTFAEHGTIEAGEACAVSVELGAAADALIDDETWIGTVPLGDGPPFVQFLRCRDDTATSISLRRPLTELDEELLLDVIDALDAIS